MSAAPETRYAAPVTRPYIKPAQAAPKSTAATAQLELVLHQAGRRGKAHVGRDRRQQQEINVEGIHAGVRQAAAGGFRGQVARSLMGRRVPSFADAGLLDHPFRIASEPVAQMLVIDHTVGDEAAGREDAHAQKGAASRTGTSGFALHHPWGVARAELIKAVSCGPKSRDSSTGSRSGCRGKKHSDGGSCAASLDEADGSCGTGWAGSTSIPGTATQACGGCRGKRQIKKYYTRSFFALQSRRLPDR